MTEMQTDIKYIREELERNRTEHQQITSKLDEAIKTKADKEAVETKIRDVRNLVLKCVFFGGSILVAFLVAFMRAIFG